MRWTGRRGATWPSKVSPPGQGCKKGARRPMAAGRERNAPGTSSSVHDAPGAAERATGFEPVTSSLGSWHSTPELRPRKAQLGRKCAKIRLLYQPGPYDRLYRQAIAPVWVAFSLND